MTVHTGKEGVGDLNDIPEGVHTGMEGGSGAGAGMPVATVLDGVSGHITLDDLAGVSYTQTGDVYEVMLVEADDPTDFHYWSCTGNSAAAQYHSILNQTGGAGDEGLLRGIHYVGSVSGIGSDATQCSDTRWHMIQSNDQYSAPNGEMLAQTDGAPRESLGVYLRAAAPAGALFTIGARRSGAGPTIDVLSPGRMAYYAMVTGVKVSQAQMNQVWDAFDTGGGRSNLWVVTRAIQAVVGAGTLQIAVELNGNRTPPHASAAGVDPPIYVDCTHGLADFGLTRWARFGAGAYALCSAADAQAMEDVYDDADGDITFIQSFEAAQVEGDETAARVMWGLANGTNDAGGSFVFSRMLAGSLNVLAWDDADAEIYNASFAATDTFEGGPHLSQHWDTAVAGAGTVRGKLDSSAAVALDTYAARASFGALVYYSPAGLVRGSTPAVIDSLSWVYFNIVVGVGLESISATIAAAYAVAVGQRAKFAAVLQAIIDGGFESDIIYAQAFWEGSTAVYGDDATLVGEVYAAEGSEP